MIVRIARVKVGNRQAPNVKNPRKPSALGGFCFGRTVSHSSRPSERACQTITLGSIVDRRSSLDDCICIQ